MKWGKEVALLIIAGVITIITTVTANLILRNIPDSKPTEQQAEVSAEQHIATQFVDKNDKEKQIVSIQDFKKNPNTSDVITTHQEKQAQVQTEPQVRKETEVEPNSLTADRAYQEGKRVAQNGNIEKALKYYQSAADRGVIAAAFEFANLLYDNGRGKVNNAEVAFKYMKIAAEADFVSAFKPLGEMYHGGRGVTKDRKVAQQWYEKAANSGDQEAKKILQDYF